MVKWCTNYVIENASVRSTCCSQQKCEEPVSRKSMYEVSGYTKNGHQYDLQMIHSGLV